MTTSSTGREFDEDAPFVCSIDEEPFVCILDCPFVCPYPFAIDEETGTRGLVLADREVVLGSGRGDIGSSIT